MKSVISYQSIKIIVYERKSFRSVTLIRRHLMKHNCNSSMNIYFAKEFKNLFVMKAINKNSTGAVAFYADSFENTSVSEVLRKSL